MIIRCRARFVPYNLCASRPSTTSTTCSSLSTTSHIVLGICPLVAQRLVRAPRPLRRNFEPRGPSASGECPHELLIVSGLSPSTKRNQASGPPRGLCPSHSALRTPLALPRVPPPDHVYSPEIALRLAYIHKIHLYFPTHRSLSARCDLSRVSCIPPHACAATCIAPNAPRGPHVSPYDHMYASANKARKHRPSPPRGGGAARPPVRGRAHTDQSS
jgi:hypothetical protein